MAVSGTGAGIVDAGSPRPRPAASDPGAAAGSGPRMTYGRARLLLGISGVGFWVVLAAGVLVAGLPGWVAGLTGGRLGWDVAAVAAGAAVVVLLQAPFDWVGGHVLPRRHGRGGGGSASAGSFAGRWVRGVAAYGSVYLVVGLALLAASRAVGAPGFVLAGAAASLALLALRTPLARLVGGLTRAETPEPLGPDAVVLAAPDVGFTGGTAGVFRPGAQLVPAHWTRTLGRDRLALALRRRREAAESGLWSRGRLGALAFTWVGLVVAAWLAGVVVRPDSVGVVEGGTAGVGGLGGAGGAGGVLAFAAVFTLWSFVGLLVLPTLSRRASTAIDARLARAGADPADLAALASALDAMQDDEPSRPRWIETIFHPIPSVTARGGASTRPRPTSRLASWDIARTSAFLGLAGLSPLGRAVHCNSGRPSLWVYLPLD